MKTKPPKEIRDRRDQKRPQSSKPALVKTPLWKRLAEWGGGPITVAGLLLTALQFQAKPTVSLDTPLDPDNVLTTQILISNEGLTDLKAISAQSFFKTLDYERDMHARDSFGRRPPINEVLAVGEKTSVQPGNLIAFGGNMSNTKVIYLDFAIVFKFRLSYWPFTKTRFFRFDAIRNTDGRLRLRQKPSGDIEQEYNKAMVSMNARR